MKIRSGDTKIPGQYKSQPKEKKKKPKTTKNQKTTAYFFLSQGLLSTGPASGTLITEFIGIEKHLHTANSRDNNQPQGLALLIY